MEYSKTPTSENADHGQHWRTGFWRRMPWMGLGCILGALLGVAASIAVLEVSDDVPITGWRFSPTVYLSISYTITNILIVGAFSEGVTISWWRRSIGEKTELGDLHRYWAFGTSPVAALGAGKNFNYIAFAALLVAITPINGPLLQRSSSIVPRSMSEPVELRVKAVSSLQEPTSFLGGFYESQPVLINDRYKPIVQSFYNGDQITVPGTGCQGDGICEGRLQAAGLAINCSSRSISFELFQDYSQNKQCIGGTVFDTSFVAQSPGKIMMYVSYKYSSSDDRWTTEPCRGCYETMRLNCTGALMVHACSLEAATVEYPVVIDGNKSAITLEPSSSIWDDVVSEITAYAPHGPRSNTDIPVGGIALAMDNIYGGNATLACGQSGLTMDTTGITPQQFANTGDVAKAKDFKYCHVSFEDPTKNMLAQARELMFRTAIAFGNDSSIQTVSGSQSRTVSTYRSHQGFLAAAVLLTLLSILVVTTTFNGFWTLGRDVSLSPVEIAKAFNAPLLEDEDSNAKATDIVKSAGRRRVMYKTLLLDEAGSTEADSKVSGEGGAEVKPIRLEIVGL